MATRGYFRIVNGEKHDEEPYHGKQDDMLIEAYHDGYVSEMLKAIIRIPHKLADMLWQGAGGEHSLWSREFNARDGYKGFHPFGVDFPDILDRAHHGFGSPFAISFNAVYQLLLFTNFGQFDHIMPGAVRYGSLVTFDDASFTVECTEDGWVDSHRIVFDETKDYNALIEDIDDEEAQLTPSLSAWLHSQITEEKWVKTLKHCPFVVTDNEIIFSIVGMTLELYWYRYLRYRPEEEEYYMSWQTSGVDLPYEAWIHDLGFNRCSTSLGCGRLVGVTLPMIDGLCMPCHERRKSRELKPK
jgi:hypothetical protein